MLANRSMPRCTVISSGRVIQTWARQLTGLAMRSASHYVCESGKPPRTTERWRRSRRSDRRVTLHDMIEFRPSRRGELASSVMVRVQHVGPPPRACRCEVPLVITDILPGLRSAASGVPILKSVPLNGTLFL